MVFFSVVMQSFSHLKEWKKIVSIPSLHLLIITTAKDNNESTVPMDESTL